MKNSSLTGPDRIPEDHRYDRFDDGQVLYGKKQGRLPAMGWNSWNAFGSGNTEALTKAMADKIKELSLDELGYKYLVLDDGCYKDERAFGRLSNDEEKFPGGFKALADYIHGKDLKFGMYNDIGTNLCAGAFVGTCGFEETDAKSYIDWGVDFLKIDNCYYLWDNATFSNPENARYVFAPNIKGIELKPFNKDGAAQADTNGAEQAGKNGTEQTDTNGKLPESIKLSATDGIITGKGAYFKDGYATGIGTFDGTNTGTTPVGDMSGELTFEVYIALGKTGTKNAYTSSNANINASTPGEYELIVEYATARVNGCGE